MNPKMKRTWAEIHLENLAHNVRNMQAQLPGDTKYLGVVKANAYGHGAVKIAKKLEKLGVGYMAVASFDEALELRAAGIRAKLLILGPSPAYLAKDIVRLGDTAQAVGSLSMAKQMAKQLEDSERKLTVHLKLDTGMSRIGFSVHHPNGISEALEALALENLEMEGVFTHFAVADDPGDGFTRVQLDRFLKAVEELEQRSGKKFPLRHCTNSGAMVNYSETYLDLVRPGIAQYGVYPAVERGALDLKPVMALKTRIAEITDHLPGDTVSYGRTYTCESNKRFAVLPIGYADGLHRALSGKLTVYINGQPAQQCGRICMDMCMADITDMPNVQVGDVVEIFGEQQGVEVLADLAGTIPYELMCAVSPRVPRVYFDKRV